MIYEVTKKDGSKYQVNDDALGLWVSLEETTGLTFQEAREKLATGSLLVIGHILFIASTKAGLTDYKTLDGFLDNEIESFDVVDDADPKESNAEALENK